VVTLADLVPAKCANTAKKLENQDQKIKKEKVTKVGGNGL